jgi:hypothetical protein
MAPNDTGYPFVRSLLILLMVGAGFCIAIQGAVNSRLRLAVDSPVRKGEQGSVKQISTEFEEDEIRVISQRLTRSRSCLVAETKN